MSLPDAFLLEITSGANLTPMYPVSFDEASQAGILISESRASSNVIDRFALKSWSARTIAPDSRTCLPDQLELIQSYIALLCEKPICTVKSSYLTFPMCFFAISSSGPASSSTTSAEIAPPSNDLSSPMRMPPRSSWKCPDV